jgi:flagella basal body P-ring formation protein FlgA
MLRALALAYCCLGLLGPGAAAADEAAAQGLGPALEAFLRERSPERIARIDLPPLDALAREAGGPGRSVAFTVHPEQKLVGTVPVGVAVFADGVLHSKQVVTAQVQVARAVVVARRTLPSGRTLTADDLALEERAVASPHADALADPAQAISRRLRRSVRAGEPLRAALLMEEQAVRRGDRVKLRLSHGGLVIEAAGRAEEAGQTGEWIRVRNLASMREVLGRIGEDGVVHVAF